MKNIPTFESFLNKKIYEGYMSELDIIRQESSDLQDFIKRAKKAFPQIAKMSDSDDFLKELWEVGSKMGEK